MDNQKTFFYTGGRAISDLILFVDPTTFQCRPIILFQYRTWTTKKHFLTHLLNFDHEEGSNVTIFK